MNNLPDDDCLDDDLPHGNTLDEHARDESNSPHDFDDKHFDDKHFDDKNFDNLPEVGTLESLLDELLGEKRPPDLRQSILNRLHELNSNSDNCKSADSQQTTRWDSAVAAAMLDTATHSSFREMLEQVAEAPPVQTHASVHLPRPRSVANASRSTDRESHWQKRLAWSSLGVVAASLLLWIGSWIGSWNHSNSPLNIHPQSIGKAEPVKADESAIAKADPLPSQRASVEAAPEAAPRKPRTLSSDDLPFEPPKSGTIAVAPNVEERQTAVVLDDRAIIETIDQQFEHLWKRSQIKMELAPEADHLVWAERAMEWMVDRGLTKEERSEIAQWTSNAERLPFATRIASSPEFANVWGARLAANWIGFEANSSKSEERKMFEAWLSSKIQEGVSLASIQAEIIRATGTDHPGVDGYSAPAHLLAKIGDGDVRIAAERLCSSMLDLPMVCSRCHDSQRMPQKNYWGFVAFLTRTNVQHAKVEGKDIRTVGIRAPKETFYEREDGSVSAAMASLPDGKPVLQDDGTLGPLAQWMAMSSLRREANVNLAWKSLFGRSLLPSYGVSEAEGLSERRELREFLGGQFGAHGEDLRQLTTWIVASRPFASRSLEPTMQQYVLASDSEVVEWRKADQLFATAAPKIKSEPASLRQLASWLESHDTKKLAQTLAQGNTSQGNVPRVLPKDTSSEHLRFIIQTQKLEDRLDAQVKLWIDSKMPFDSLVDHATWLSKGHSAGSGQHEMARKVLSSSNGEKRLAIIRILMTELGYF